MTSQPGQGRDPSGEPAGGRDLSFAVLAMGVIGSAVAVLAITAFLLAVLPVSPPIKAVIALVGIIAAIGGMGLASRSLTNRAIRRQYGDDESTDPANTERRPGH